MTKKFYYVFGLIFLCATLCYAAEYSVPSQYSTIQAAIDASSSGDTILISDGTYTGEGNRDLNTQGKGILIESENGRDSCVIDCGIVSGHRGFEFDTGEDAGTILNGITIINGNTDVGGAVKCDNTSPIIRNCAFSNNDATYFGGAIYCASGAAPQLINCVFSTNESIDEGGAVYCDASSPAISQCSFSANTAAGTDGGAVSCYDTGSEPTITGCTFTGNLGCGIYCMNSSLPIITGCTISGNDLGIRSRSDSQILDCTITDQGVGIFLEGGNPTISNCVISGNGTNFDGGGIHASGATLIVENCLITSNSAGNSGGGVYCENSYLTMRNCTVTGNSTSGLGGGLLKVSSIMSISDCIFWGNSPDEIFDFDGSNLTVDFSDVQLTAGVFPGTGNINADPQFTGGPDGDFYLNSESGSLSPCIDVGSDDAENVCITTIAGSVCMNELSSSADNTTDTGRVDMGYHYGVSRDVPAMSPWSAAIVIGLFSLYFYVIRHRYRQI